LGEACVHLAGDDAAAAVEECVGEGARAGADFEDGFGGLNVGGVDEFGDEVLIDEEVLAEGVTGREAAGLEHGADLLEGLHPKNSEFISSYSLFWRLYDLLIVLILSTRFLAAFRAFSRHCKWITT